VLPAARLIARDIQRQTFIGRGGTGDQGAGHLDPVAVIVGLLDVVARGL